jgi:hypothetical protein
MTTHTITEDTTSYRFPNSNSLIAFSYLSGAQVTVTDEYLGTNCEYFEISSSEGTSYLSGSFLQKLETTPESAPYVCFNVLPNFRYVEPEWFTLPDNKPFFNEKTLEYSVTVTTSYLNFANEQALRNEIINKGLKQLLTYYDKPNDDVTIERLKNYFIFAKIKDTYVPYRRMSRIKGLLTVPKKYFDAVQTSLSSQQQTPFNNDISDANFVLRFAVFEIKDLFETLAKILNLYETDVLYSNSKIGFSFGTQTNEFFDTSSTIINQLSLSQKANDVLKFYNNLNNLLLENGFDITENSSTINKNFIEFAINDNCNKIYDIAINNGTRCIKLRTGIETFLATNPANDSTIVAFIKNIDRITKIEKCKVPWPEFVETYVYPKVKVQNVSINDVLQNFEKNKFEYAKDLIQIFNSIEQDSKYKPALTYEEAIQESIDIGNFNSTMLWNNLKKSIFDVSLYSGDNDVDPSSLDRFYDNLQASLSNSNNLFEKEIPSIMYDGQNYIPVIKDAREDFYITDIANSQYTFSLGELVVVDPSNPRKNFKDLSGIISSKVLYKSRVEQVTNKARKEEFFLNQIYEKLNIFGLCKMIDFSLNCTLSLARDLFEGDVQVDITSGVIARFNSDRIAKDLVKYLPQEQQELVYEELLKRTCLNTRELLFILKKFLPQDLYERDFQNYENTLNVNVSDLNKNLTTQVAKLMSTSVQ